MEKVIRLFEKLGYNEEDIKNIINANGIKDLKPETLLKNIEKNYKFLIEQGYTKEDIIKMAKFQPLMYAYSIENMKNKIEQMQELGYTKEEVIKMTKILPVIYSHSIENMKNKIEQMQELGYTKEEVIKMTKNQPSIYGYSIENMQNKIEQMQKLGYTEEEAIKMTKILPSIYNLSIENMQNKIEQMQKLGYTKEEVIKITKILPSIYSYSIENMQNKMEQMQELGYTKEEVIKMTESLPSIYSLSIENMQEKIEFYNSINLHSFAVKSPKYLMQSTALSYARYMFFKEKNITIDENSYNKLFVNQKQFEKSYGITKQELLFKYDYQKYRGQKSTVVEKEKKTVQEWYEKEWWDMIYNIEEQSLAHTINKSIIQPYNDSINNKMIPTRLKNAIGIQEWFEKNGKTRLPSTISKDEFESQLGRKLNKIRNRIIKPYNELRTEEERQKYKETHPVEAEIIQIIKSMEEKIIPTNLKASQEIQEWFEKNGETRWPSRVTKNIEERRLGQKLHYIKDNVIKKYVALETEEEKEEYRKKYPEIEEVMSIIANIELKIKQKRECNNKKTLTEKTTQALGKETIDEQNDTQYINETEHAMGLHEKNIKKAKIHND